jgi:UDP-glucose 4-epimerase
LKVLITGCAGYIGSVVSKFLLEKGVEVVGLDNLSTGNTMNIPDQVDFFYASIADVTTLKQILVKHRDIDCVIHLAGYIEVAESVLDPDKYYRNNYNNSKTFVDFLISQNITNIIYSSTAAVYSPPTKRVKLAENHATSPINPYGESKLMFEQYLQKKPELNYVTFRFFNASGAFGRYGECHQPETHLIPIVIDFALDRRDKLYVFGDDYDSDDGTAIRDYIHVLDLSIAHYLALKALYNKNSKIQRQTFNLGYGRGFSVKHIINMVEKLTAKPIKYQVKPRRDGDPPYLVANTEKIEHLLGFKPKHDNILHIINDAIKHREYYYRSLDRK